MGEFFSMHGYGAYIWTAYGVFFVVLLADALGPILRAKRTLAALRGRFKREAARGTSLNTEDPA